ncbi:hypothetical protein BP5796_01620 [Coleophoma crateriformis]|uniref:Uncharacterized protein n=1 Tax=Coleophoma crateriformis TaxID=565419 RepID=A0A3D8T0Z0_9HELO|nr:hypothetical protein BP5796_01620 [Coleophoma crateriformis]
MAVADLISAWFLRCIAPIILYFARQYAIHRGWLRATPIPPVSPADMNREILLALQDILWAHRADHENIRSLLAESLDTLKDIRGAMDRSNELGEARERDGGMPIYQHIPTLRVPRAAAAHLDG